MSPVSIYSAVFYTFILSYVMNCLSVRARVPRVSPECPAVYCRLKVRSRVQSPSANRNFMNAIIVITHTVKACSAAQRGWWFICIL